MAYITRRERFSAAHRLYRDDFTEQENFEYFGNCSHSNWHGHNFELFVTVKGEINPKLGFVVNLKTISKLIKDLVVDKLDHKNINIDVEFMRGKIASTENLAVAIWGELEIPFKELGADLHCVKILETENNSVEYFGDR
ncbi:MAG: 6-carboxytetrahydropterin synthase [Bacteroidales bacterium]|nr:6-carboxytetrahydropterin synthase [Bacteroidales bacterium]